LCYLNPGHNDRISKTRTAIFAADVVGLGRQTDVDEDRTLARLRALRSDLIDPTIAVHKARVVKGAVDGALVEFRSVVDAVRCAIEVHDAIVERNVGVPADRTRVLAGARLDASHSQPPPWLSAAALGPLQKGFAKASPRERSEPRKL
jgi:class 3 adenylate cyclase